MTEIVLALGVLAILVPVLFRSRMLSILERLTKKEGSRRRILVEDALKYIQQCETGNETVSVEGLSGRLAISRDRSATLLEEMIRRGLLRLEEDRLSMTDEGRDYAVQVIRAHRLWERYLADHTGLSEDEWHRRADKLEHSLSPGEADQLSLQLGNPVVDPHGDPVPGKDGAVLPLEGSSLRTMETGEHARIVHVEDEPPSVYSELVGQGLYPGVEFRLVERTGDRFLLRSEGSEREISSLAAGNLTVRRTSGESEKQFRDAIPLSALRNGQSGRVLGISKASRGTERRRFMDLGILPGTAIKAELSAPGGDPVAYSVRGALIALRKEQAQNILVAADQEERVA